MQPLVRILGRAVLDGNISYSYLHYSHTNNDYYRLWHLLFMTYKSTRAERMQWIMSGCPGHHYAFAEVHTA